MTSHGSLALLEPDDDEALVERVRLGDNVAFENLYRRHSRLAVSVAQKALGSRQDAEDAAAEAFTNVLSALRRQAGPREMFRPYLLACVRNSCSLRMRQRSRQKDAKERNLLDADTRDDETVVESAVAAAAFRAIPERWQSALWMAEVQHLDLVTIADRLGVNVASATALVYRARQGFTEAYLAQHLRNSGQQDCAALGPKLAQYVRGTAGTMATRQVETHIATCSACASALVELADVNSSLRSLTAPVSIATAGAAAASSGGAASMAATGLGFGWLAKVAVVAALAAPVLGGGEAQRPVLDGHATAGVDTAALAPVSAGSASIVTSTSWGRSRGAQTLRVGVSARNEPIVDANPVKEHGTGAAAPLLPSGVDPVASPSIEAIVPSLPSHPPVVDPPWTQPVVPGVLPTVALPSLPIPSSVPITVAPVVALPSLPEVPTPTIPAIAPVVTVAVAVSIPNLTVPAIGAGGK